MTMSAELAESTLLGEYTYEKRPVERGSHLRDHGVPWQRQVHGGDVESADGECH